MPTNFVFLIHGMGSHAKGWSDAWKTCLEANAKLFAPYADGKRKLSDDVEYVEIVYDNVFEDGYRKRWQNLATALKDSALPAAVKPALAEIGQFDDARLPDYAWTHLLDPLLWFGLGQARQAAIKEVTWQLAEGAVLAQAAGADMHILAHSLGTSVIHDVLVCLAADKPEGFDPSKGGKRWRTLVTVSNVSRFLNALESPSASLGTDAFKPHSSRVKPGDLVSNFITVRHRCDPFTYPRTFKPDWKKPPIMVLEPERFDELLHVHDLETQFDNPVVARESLSAFTGRPTLGLKKGEMSAAWTRYEKRYGKSGPFAFPMLASTLTPDADRDLGLGELARYLTGFVKEALA